jgi:hypothetical protein
VAGKDIKLGVISIEMIRSRFRSDMTEWNSIQDKEKRSKNRSLTNPIQQLKNRGFSAI